MPLFVMVTTSLKTLDEIRAGNLLSLPGSITFEAWVEGLGHRLHRRGLRRAEGQLHELGALRACPRCSSRP